MDPVATLQDDRGEDDEMREHNKKKTTSLLWK